MWTNTSGKPKIIKFLAGRKLGDSKLKPNNFYDFLKNRTIEVTHTLAELHTQASHKLQVLYLHAA